MVVSGGATQTASLKNSLANLLMKLKANFKYLTDSPIALDSEGQQSSSHSPDCTESSALTTKTLEYTTSSIYHAIRRVEAKITTEANVEVTTNNAAIGETTTAKSSETVKMRTEDGIGGEEKENSKEVEFTSTEQIAQSPTGNGSEEKLNLEQKTNKTKNSGSTTMLKITRRGDAPEVKNSGISGNEGNNQKQTSQTTVTSNVALSTTATSTTRTLSTSSTMTPYQKAVPFEAAAEETSDCSISAIGIRAMDPQKLMLAGPIFFMLGLVSSKQTLFV